MSSKHRKQVTELNRTKRSRVVDLNTYEPKTNGTNRALFVELKRIEMETFQIMDRHNVPLEEQGELNYMYKRLRDVMNHSKVTKVNGTRKKNKYRVIITVNGRRKSVVNDWINLEPATKRFNELLDEGQAVHLPKIEISKSDYSIEVKYGVSLLKWYEPGDVRRYRRDDMGKIYQEDFVDGSWVVLDTADYFIEETFTAYGYPIHKKFNVSDIIREILPKHTDKFPMKQMYLLNHRVYLEYGHKMDIITAITPETALKLYNKLSEVVANAGMNNIYCAGHITDYGLVGAKYKEIMRVTGWNKRKVSRTTNIR